MFNDRIFQSLYENSPVAMIICASGDWRLISANASATRMLGMSGSELSSLNLKSITYPADWDKFLKGAARIRTGLEVSAQEDIRLVKNDIMVLPARVQISRVGYDEETRDLIVLMFHEPLRREHRTTEVVAGNEEKVIAGAFSARAHLQEPEDSLRDTVLPQISADKLVEAFPGGRRTLKRTQSIAKLGVWKMNLANEVLEWSGETYRIFGISKAKKLLYQDFLGLVHPDDRDLIDAAWQSAIRSNCVYDVEHRIISKGKIKWVREQCEFESDESGRPFFAVGVVQDITETKMAKIHLEEKNRELQEIMDALDESSLVSIADAKGVILKVNKRFCEVAKYHEEELVGKSHNIINSGYHDKNFWADFWRTIQRGKVWRGEIRNRAKDGTEYWVNTTINPICDKEGNIIHYLSIRQDITSRKMFEELLVQSNFRLAQIEQFMDYTSDAIQVSQPDGRFVYINEVASQRLGIARGACSEYNAWEVDILFGTANEWSRRVCQVKKTDSLSVEGISRNGSTGTLYPVEITMRYISIHSRDYVIVVSRDITERRKNEKVLRESQARLAEAQRMARLGYWELDLKSGALWWSDLQYEINGIAKSAGPLTKEDCLGLLHPDDREKFIETAERCLSQQREASVTYRIIRPDSDVRLITGYLNVIVNDAGEPVKLSGVSQDITERMMTEKALRESEETLRKAQAVAKIGSWKLNVNAGVLEWSDEVYRMFDVPREKKLTYKDFLSYVHPEDKEYVDKSWAAALKGEPYDIVHRIIINKKVKWVREQAELTFDGFKNVIFGFGTVQDITDQKILQDSNLIFNQSLLFTGLGSWRISFRTHDVFLSDNVYNLHGITKDDPRACFQRFPELIVPDDRGRIRIILSRVLLTNGSFETEYRVELAPGSIRWLFAKGKVLTDQDGLAMEMYGIVRDITTEKNSTYELIKARKEAEEASHIKDEFLSVMSHEIRTPLNSVIGLSNLILKRNPREDQLEIMKTLKGAADNLLYLVNDILDFNKIRAGKLQLEFIPFSLTKFLQHLHASFRLSAIDKKIDLSMHTDASIPDRLIGDVTRLNQIFNNLLANAIKFTHAGFVRFRVDLESITKQECRLVFRVEDTGVGITTDKLGSIFQPFQQSERDTSRKYGGTGLGLSIVKSLVEILQGDIAVHSIPGRGSVFSVVLPFRLAPHVDAKKIDMKVRAATHKERNMFSQRKPLNVLYVEDVESNRFLVENLLADHYITAVSASSGKEALRLTAVRRFDLIIMDIQMPGMDGYQTTRRIRDQESGKNINTPILAFTAEPLSEELKRKVNYHGIQDVLTKPFDEAVLIGKIRSCTSVETEEKMFSFDFYFRAFDGDRMKLSKIKRAILHDLNRFCTKAALYSTKQDWSRLGEEVHRIRPIIKNLECGVLVALLEKLHPSECGDGIAAEIVESAVNMGRQLSDAINEMEL